MGQVQSKRPSPSPDTVGLPLADAIKSHVLGGRPEKAVHFQIPMYNNSQHFLQATAEGTRYEYDSSMFHK